MAGSISKDKKSWYYVLELGRGEDGKRKQKKVRGFKTKREAQIALSQAETEVNTGIYIEPTKLTLSQFIHQWLPERKLAVKRITYINNMYYIEHYIEPHIGSVKMDKITPYVLQSYLQKIVSKNLAPGTIHKMFQLLNIILNKAVKLKVIRENPLSAVELPKNTKVEMSVWDVEQANKFMKSSVKCRYHKAFLLALLTGMRQGEILGLRWKDVDLDNGIIYIRQTLSHDGKEFQIGAKTSAGVRSIHIPKVLIEQLRIHHNEITEEKRHLGNRYEDNDLVICTKNGGPVAPQNLVKAFKKEVQKAGLPIIRFHDLRHTHATILISQNVHPKLISERLGHSRIGITLDTYSHVLPSMQKEVAEELDKLMTVTI